MRREEWFLGAWGAGKRCLDGIFPQVKLELEIVHLVRLDPWIIHDFSSAMFEQVRCRLASVAMASHVSKQTPNGKARSLIASTVVSEKGRRLRYSQGPRAICGSYDQGLDPSGVLGSFLACDSCALMEITWDEYMRVR